MAVIFGVVIVVVYSLARTSASNNFFDVRIVKRVSAGHGASGVNLSAFGPIISKLPRICGLIFIYLCKSFLLIFIANAGAYGPDSH